MKFTVQKSTFIDRLTLLNAATLSKSADISATMARIEADDGLTFSALADSTALTCHAEATVIDGGSVVVPAALLHSMIQSFPAFQIDCEVVGNALVMSAGTVSVQCATYESFPPMPVYPKATTTLDGRAFAEAVKKAIPCAAKVPEQQGVLAGVCLYMLDGQLLCCGTDSYEMVITRLEGEVKKGFTISLKAAALAERIAARSKEVSIGQRGNVLLFAVPDIEVCTTTMTGDYPNIGALVPTDGLTIVKVNRGAFSDAVNRAKIVALTGTDAQRCIVFKVAFDYLGVGALTSSGKHAEKIPAEVHLDNGEFVVKFAPRIVDKIDDFCKEDDVTISFITKKKNTMMVQEENFSYLAVAMGLT